MTSNLKSEKSIAVSEEPRKIDNMNTDKSLFISAVSRREAVNEAFGLAIDLDKKTHSGGVLQYAPTI